MGPQVAKCLDFVRPGCTDETAALLRRAITGAAWTSIRNAYRKGRTTETFVALATGCERLADDAREQLLSRPWIASLCANIREERSTFTANAFAIPFLRHHIAHPHALPLDFDGPIIDFPGETFHLTLPRVPDRATATLACDELAICCPPLGTLRLGIDLNGRLSLRKNSAEVLLVEDTHESFLGLHVDTKNKRLQRRLASFLADAAGPGSSSRRRLAPLTDADRPKFLADIGSAASLLAAAAPTLAREIRGMVQVVVPLQKINADYDYAVSFTLSDWPGTVFLTHEEPLRLGELLAHEAGHVKLYQVMLIDPLIDGHDPPRFHSPWREDLRPLSGILHGTYTYLRVAHYYSALRMHTPTRSNAFNKRLAEILSQMGAACAILTDQTCYTDLGAAFVAALDSEVRQAQALARLASP